MFTLYATGSMLGYALQGALLAQRARGMDGLSLALYRGLSLILTLLPLLIGSTWEECTTVLRQWPTLILAGIGGASYLACTYAAYRSLPIGVTIAIYDAVGTILILILGWFLLNDRISLAAMGLIVLILIGTFTLTMSTTTAREPGTSVQSGIVFSVFAGISLAITYYALLVLSRESNPLVSGYFWEVSIALGTVLLIVLRFVAQKKKLQLVTLPHFFLILLCALPTLAGTALLALALQSGPAAIATAIGSGAIVVTALLGWWVYRERLSMLQWSSIVIVCGSIIALKFA